MTAADAPPLVLILRQAMDVIRREALAFDVETGGILVGAKAGEGAILVTHATPPGPKAVHNAVYFQRDVAFQQAALNGLHQRYGVQYLGEWHKHPRGLPVPSGGDLQGVKELLSDPDYGVDAILFPIVICEPDLGFRFHPFYITNREADIRFRPFPWRELAFDVDLDRVFTDAVAPAPASVLPETASEGRFATTSEKSSPSQPPRSSPWQSITRFLPFVGRAADGNTDGGGVEAAAKGTDAGATSHWYTVAEGQERLGREQALLRSFGLIAEPFMIGDGRLCFSFPRAGGRELVVICSDNYPENAPHLMVRDTPTGKHRALRVCSWTPNTHLADIIVPLLGPRVPGVGDNGCEPNAESTQTGGLTT
ncbi:MAG: Mov34/MPN/PAD-1 family protein [Phycisphaerae bacterium]